MKWTMVLLLVILGVECSAPGVELSGVLRDNHGHGLGGISLEAWVYAGGHESQITAITDNAGRFTMRGEPGWWRDLNASVTNLNARGYFGITARSLTITNNLTVELTTRRISFSHRLIGRVVDEAGKAIVGWSLKARIRENRSLFETNVVTGADGSFTLAAVPALWSLCCLEPPVGTSVERVLGEQLVEVQETNLEQRLTLVAPLVTATISVIATNLGGWDVVVSAEAFGTKYRLSQSLPIYLPDVGYGLQFPVFAGVWTIALTNVDKSLYAFSNTQGTPPAPEIVTVTNGVCMVPLTSAEGPALPKHALWVRAVTASGAPVTNTWVYAVGSSGFLISGSTQDPPSPGLSVLQLPEGEWRITARLASPPYWLGQSVSCSVVVASNMPLPEVRLVFPDENAEPQISGTVRTRDGAGLAGSSVTVGMSQGGTNYSGTQITDALGHFGFHVFPGRWQVTAYQQHYRQGSNVVVAADQDCEVNFEMLLPTSGTVPVSMSIVDESGSPVPDASLSVQNGSDYIETNGVPTSLLLLQPSIWRTSVTTPDLYAPSDPYMLTPLLTVQVLPGPATNIVLATRRASARIEGRLRDEQGRLLLSGYAAGWTSVNGTNFWSYGAVDSGYFSLNVFPGDWQVGASLSSYPSVGEGDTATISLQGSGSGWQPSSFNTTPPLRWVRVSNDTARCDFVLTNVPEPLLTPVGFTVVREDGGNLTGIIVSGWTLEGEFSVVTDREGEASVSAPAGILEVFAGLVSTEFANEPLLWPSVAVEFTAPSNHVVLVARRPEGWITGTLSNATNFGLQPRVIARAEINGTNYAVGSLPDSAGRYRLPVLSGVWNVQLDNYYLCVHGIRRVDAQRVIVPEGGEGSADFRLSPSTDNVFAAHFLSPVLRPGGGFQLRLRGFEGSYWRVERSEDLIDWSPVGLAAVYSNEEYVCEYPVAVGRPVFYRAVWVR